MESPLPPTPRRLTRPGLAAAVLAAALLAGCSTTQGGAPRTTRAPASGPAPRVDTSPVFAPRRQGGTMDPGSRYLPHVDPVGSEPAETPPLDVR